MILARDFLPARAGRRDAARRITAADVILTATQIVLVDGLVVGHPTYNLPRPDVKALFPGLANVDGPGGYFEMNAWTLTNGLHTVSWVVRDNAGQARQVGSRYFRVSIP